MADDLQTLQAIIDSDGEQIFALDRDGRYSAFNRAHAAAMRALYGAEIAVGERQSDYAITAADREAALKAHDRALTGERFVISMSLGEAGRQRAFEIVHAPQLDASGEIVGVVIRARDVTDLDRVESDLCESQQRFGLLLAHMREGFAYCRLLSGEEGAPPDFVYLMVNPAFERLTGLKDVVGRRVSEVIPGIADKTPEILEMYGAVVETGESAECEIDFTPLGLWLRITAFRPEPGHFVAVFSEVGERRQAEAALRASEERYRSVFEASHEGVMLQDRDGRVIAWNAAAARIFGVGAAAILAEPEGARDWAAVHEDGSPWPLFEFPSRVTLATGAPCTDVVMGFVREGEIRWINLDIAPLFTEGEALPTAVMTSVVDITAQKEALDALHRSEAMRDIAEQVAHVGSWTFDLATQKATWSPEMYQLFGLAPEEYDGWSLAELLAMRVHPDDRATVAEATSISLATREPVPVEYRVVLPDGTERIVHGEGRADRDANGTLVALAGYYQDVTELRRAEQAQRESEQAKSRLLDRLNEAQGLAGIGSWEWDLASDRVWWSDETYVIFGVTPEAFAPSFEANGEFIHPDDRARYRASFAHSLETGAKLDAGFRLIAGDGRLKYCSARGEVMADAAGRPIRYVGTVMDVTERKRA
jgi:PAS domain S-box-containing protein